MARRPPRDPNSGSHEPCGYGHEKPKGKPCGMCANIDPSRNEPDDKPKKPEVTGNSYTCQNCKDDGLPNGCPNCGVRG